MSFIDALRFPFQKSSLTTIFKIVTVYLIIKIILTVISYSYLPAVEISSFIYANLSFVFIFFVNGYSIDVIQHQRANQEGLPKIELKRNFENSLKLLATSLLHFLPIIIAYLLASGIANPNMMTYRNYDQAASGGAFLFACGFWLLVFAISFFIHGALSVGIARFALEGQSENLFQFSINFGYVNENKSIVMGYFIRSIGLVLGYSFLIYALFWLIVYGTTDLVWNSPRSISTWLAIAIGLFNQGLQLWLIISLQLSIAHLQAQFGQELNIFFEKGKNEVTTV